MDPRLTSSPQLPPTYRQPLTENQKIPISQTYLDQLCEPHSGLHSEQLSALFRVDTEERARPVARVFSYAIESTPPQTGTEELFH